MVFHSICVIILTIYLCIFIWGISAQDSGPYEIVIISIDNCEDKGTGEITVSSTKRTDEQGKVVLTGDLTLPQGVNDQMKATGDAYIMSNGDWKPIGLIYKMAFPKACSSVKSLAPIWFGIIKAAGMESKCPVPEGTHHFVDYRIATKIANMNQLKYGEYRVRVSYFKKNQKMGCLRYIANVIPK